MVLRRHFVCDSHVVFCGSNRTERLGVASSGFAYPGRFVLLFPIRLLRNVIRQALATVARVPRGFKGNRVQGLATRFRHWSSNRNRQFHPCDCDRSYGDRSYDLTAFAMTHLKIS